VFRDNVALEIRPRARSYATPSANGRRTIDSLGAEICPPGLAPCARRRDRGGATRPRARSDQCRKGDAKSAGNRGARSPSARALGEMRPSDEQLLGPQDASLFSNAACRDGRFGYRATGAQVRTPPYKDVADRVV